MDRFKLMFKEEVFKFDREALVQETVTFGDFTECQLVNCGSTWTE